MPIRSLCGVDSLLHLRVVHIEVRITDETLFFFYSVQQS